ncbi:MAG: DUF177 domain-containing protein [Firmicutes bacterium]|nr:DUF177 domain-containing protein [Bacillota bacterium]
MRINISSLLGQKGASFLVEEELSSSFVESAPEVDHVLSPIQAQIKISNTGEGFLVTAEFSFEVALYCSRCLRPFTTILEASAAEEYRYQPRQQSESHGEFFPDEEPLVEGNELDLTSLIQETVLMSIPMKNVCEESCPGLCPVCGGVLAEESCDCLDPKLDIRMSPLKELLQSRERRKENGSTKEKTLKSED